MQTISDTEFLKRAQTMADMSPEAVACGCVIVRDDRVIASAFYSQGKDHIAIYHAEIKALVAANYKLGRRDLIGASAFCTCEPCAMCLAALSYAKVGRIVYAHKLAELFPKDKQGLFNSQAFVNTLNFVPNLEQIIV